MKIKRENPICPKCGNKDVRSRLRTKDFWCRRCGFIGRKKDFFKGDKDVKDTK